MSLSILGQRANVLNILSTLTPSGPLLGVVACELIELEGLHTNVVDKLTPFCQLNRPMEQRRAA